MKVKLCLFHLRPAASIWRKKTFAFQTLGKSSQKEAEKKIKLHFKYRFVTFFQRHFILFYFIKKRPSIHLDVNQVASKRSLLISNYQKMHKSKYARGGKPQKKKSANVDGDKEQRSKAAENISVTLLQDLNGEKPLVHG